MRKCSTIIVLHNRCCILEVGGDNMMNYTQKLKHYPDVLSADQAAEILGISIKTLYKTIKAKELHAVKIGREYRIVKTKLIEMLLS